MGAGLNRRATTIPAPLQQFPAPARLALAGKATTLPAHHGPAHYRTDAHCRRSSRPKPPLFSGLLEPPADAPDKVKTCLEVVFAQMPEPAYPPPKQANRKAGQGDEQPAQHSGAEPDVVVDQVNPAKFEHGNTSQQQPDPPGEDDSRQADQQPEPEHVAID